MSLQISQLHYADWAHNFAPQVLQRGQQYAKHGMARIIRVEQHSIEARCLGSTERPYQQHIRLRAEHQRWQLNARCSCPQGGDCKHLVAVLLSVEQLQQRNDPLGMPVARVPTQTRQIDHLRPTALLRLGSHTRMHFDARKGRMVEQTQHRAALSFIYGQQTTFGRGQNIRVRQGDENLLIQRDLEAEEAFRQRLTSLGFGTSLRRSQALPEGAGEPFELHSENAWLTFMQLAAPQLREAGWIFNIADGFRYQLATIEDWYLDIEPSHETHWFNVEPGIQVAGRRVSLVPILLDVLRQTPWLLAPAALAERTDDDLLLVTIPAAQRQQPLRAGLPFARLKPLLATFAQLYFHAPDSTPTTLRMHRVDTLRLEQQSTALSSSEDQYGSAVTSHPQPRSLPPVEVPQGLMATLRPYQLEGLAWMQHLRSHALGGLLADDMGLGKTLQSLAHILTEKQAGRLTRPALIVVPTSLIGNWQEEAARFTPQLKVLALHGPKRKQRFTELEHADLVLTTYALLSRDARELSRQHYHLLLLDEAQNIKNPRSRAANAARALHAEQRLCLTGTPLENHLGELWSLFNFLMPGWLGDAKSFMRDYRQPIEKRTDPARLAHLTARLRPVMLRRTKEAVASELPEKTVITQWVELTEQQQVHYEKLRQSMDTRVRQEIAEKGLAASQILVLEALLRLRQACCDLRLLGDEQAYTAQDSGKLVLLLEMLESLISQGRRVLVFSQFTRMLKLIEAQLQQRGIAYALLTGATRDRSAPVQAFQAGELPVFLISLKAGGAGLNLTAADTVIHFDPWWNPAAEAQASDRAHRIGQTKPVFVYRLIARGSVEEHIQRLQQSKAALAQALYSNPTTLDSRLSTEDLLQLMAPMR